MKMDAPENLDQFEVLTQINIDDMLGAFGWKEIWVGRHWLRKLCQRPAQHFARQVIHFDQLVAQGGVAAGAAWLLETFHNRLRVQGQEHIPSSGPVLILANHPGLTDVAALFVSIPRQDLRVVAADRPFLRALPNTSRYLIYLDEAAPHNLTVVRAATAHLRQGGAILTFPAGKIEPDPAVLPGAEAALADWSNSVALFVRLAPETQVVPVLVSGVLSPRAQHHPLRYLRRSRKDREWLAAMLQILVPAYQAVTVQVTFASPIQPRGHGAAADHRLVNSIKTAMQQLITTVELQARS